MKPLKKILLTIATVIVLIPVCLCVVIQLPSVQNAAVQKASMWASDMINGRISMGRVYFSFPNRLIIRDICVTQESPADTVLYLDKLLLNVSYTALAKNEIRARRVALDDGKFNLRYADDSTTNLSLILSPLQKKNSSSSGFDMAVKADRISVKNIDFSLSNPFSEKAKQKYGLDFNDLDVRDIKLDIRKFCYDDSLTCHIRNISLNESKGLSISTFIGDLNLDSNHILLENFIFEDADSHLESDTLSFNFDSFSDFNDFCEKVRMDCNFHNTTLDFNTLRNIAGVDGIKLVLNLEGRVSGPVADLKSQGLSVTTPSEQTSLLLKFRLLGLPDVDNTLVNVTFKELYTYSSDIADILSKVSPGFKKSSVSGLAPGQLISFSGAVDGLLTDLVAKGHLSIARMGSADLNVFCAPDETSNYTISGFLSSDELSLGGILGSKALGKLTCEAGFSASFDKPGYTIQIDSLDITKLGLLDYDYRNIAVDGVLTEKDFKGSVISRDPNLNMDFTGEVTFNQEHVSRKFDLYRFNLALNRANLDSLHLDKRNSSVRMNVNADVNVSDRDIFGKVNVDSFFATLEKETFDMGDINLRAYLSDGRYLMRLNSGLANADFRGTASVVDFVSALINTTARTHLTNLSGERDSKGLGQEYSFELTTADLQPVFKFFAPEVYVSKGTKLNLKMGRDNALDAGITSDFVAVGDRYIKGIKSDIHGNDESVSVNLDTKLVEIGNLKMLDDCLKLKLKDNRAEIGLGVRDIGSSSSGSNLNFSSLLTIPVQEKEKGLSAVLDILPSELAIKGDKWNLEPSRLSFSDRRLSVDGLRVLSSGNSIAVDGIVSDNPSDTVNVSLNNFPLSIVQALISSPMALSGSVSGHGEAFGILGQELGALLDVQASDVFVGDDCLGDLLVRSRWDDSNSRFNILARNTLEDATPLSMRMYFVPRTKSVDASLNLDRFGVGFAETLLSGIASDVNGSVSGKINLKGPLDKLSISSEGGRINDLKFKLDFTQVPYVLDGPFSITEKGVRFNNIVIKDMLGNKGNVGGSVDYEYFKNIRLNTRITLNEMLGLDTGASDDASFYGKAFATGTVRLTGPTDRIKIALSLTTDPNTSIHIPLSSTGKNHSSLLTFVGNEKILNEYDSLRTSRSVKKYQHKSELQVSVNVTATPDAEIKLDINPITGDALKAVGEGKIAIDIGAQDGFSLKGNYTIHEGDFMFNLMGITSRNFILDNGSTINFNGDIMNSELGLTATYRTKASIETLLSNATSVGARRTVDCGIGVSGKLSNPQIVFNIDIPDLDPGTKSKIENTLNTEDKRMRQVLALLVSGSFVPENESGIVNNTTILYSNASEIMSNQLNNIFRQLDIPVDLGFNYQPTQNGHDIFDVAISTQLFNNRVTINGNIGNRRYNTSSSRDFVGDVDVEIKMNNSGKLRLNVFSHSADEYSNLLDQSQRNGAGFSYQEEFDSFKELSRKIFWSKARREEEQQKEALKRREELRAIMEQRRLEREESAPATTTEPVSQTGPVEQSIER